MDSHSAIEVYDLLILVDATGSMGTYLASLRHSLPQVISISALTKCFDRIGLLAYRDYCDRNLIMWSGWTTPSEPSNTQPNLVDVASKLRAEGGGDAPEAVKTGLSRAYQYMRSDATTMILLYTDAPPHMAWDDAKGSNAEKERQALSFNPFADWVSASRTFRSGEKKAQIMSILQGYGGQRPGYYEYLSAMTEGSTFYVQSRSAADISKITVEVLLSWMGVRKAGTESVHLPARISQYCFVGDISRLTSETDFEASEYFDTKKKSRTTPLDEIDVSSKLLDQHLLKKTTPLQDFAKTYKLSAPYRRFVADQLREIIERDVSAISLNPVFGSLWRTFCNDRENESRQSLLDLFGRKVESIQSQSERTGMKTWLEESYDFEADIQEAVAMVPETERFPCVCLDPTITFTSPDSKHHDEESEDRPITSFRRDELLEIGRSCDWRILRRLSRVMTRLTFIESADAMQAHIASAPDSVVRKMPMALASPKYGRKFWRMLLHIIVPGTMLSARPAALLAALSIKLGIEPLAAAAEQETLLWRDRWNDVEIPETWNVNCLSLLLDADHAYQKRHDGPSDAALGLVLDKDRVLFQRLIDYKMLELNLNTTLTAQVGWSPTKTTMPIGPIVICRDCLYPRSVTIMGPDGLCGMCCCTSFGNVEHERKAKSTRVSESDDEKTRAIWYECSVQECRAQYVVYCVEALNVRPKCHFCRQQATIPAAQKSAFEAPVVECNKCLSRMIWPVDYRPEGLLDWTCVACETEVQTIINVETTAAQLRIDNKGDWLLKNVDRKLKAPFNNRTLFHTASTSVPLDDFADKVQVLPSRSDEDVQLFLAGKLIRNTSDLLNELHSWISRRRTESGTCSLCFSNIRKSDLLPACGRSACTQRICKTCLEGWYGLNAAGRIINTAALNCPFCRRSPTAKTLAKYGMGVHAVGGLREAVEHSGTWVYAWCVDCGYAKQYIERVCAAGAPADLQGWTCDDCREVRARAEGAQVNKIKPCPSCGIPTEKLSGCDHTQCTVQGCGAHWCFFCGKQCNGDTIYDHMSREHGGYYGGGEYETDDEMEDY